jgi:hypothetical protein
VQVVPAPPPLGDAVLVMDVPVLEVNSEMCEIWDSRHTSCTSISLPTTPVIVNIACW